MAAARSDLEQARAGYLPRLELTAVTGPARDADEPIIRNNRIHDPSPGLSPETIGIFGRLDATITQPLYTFGKIAYREEAARRGLVASELEAAGRETDIARRVTRLYYALVLARSGMQAADEGEDFFAQAQQRISRLLELGAASVLPTDLYRLQAARAATRSSRAEARKGAELAAFALKALAGISPEATLMPADTALPVRQETVLPLSGYIDRALAERPELARLKEALAARRAQVEAARADRLPSFFLALESSVAVAPGRDEINNPYIDDEFNHAYAGVVAGLKWDFDFGGSSRVAKARAEYQQLRHTLAAAKLNIPIQVAQSYQELLEWRTTAESYAEGAAAARRWVVSAQSDFDIGVGEAGNLLDAIEKYGELQGKYLGALYNYNLTRAELAYATGTGGRPEDGKR